MSKWLTSAFGALRAVLVWVMRTKSVLSIRSLHLPLFDLKILNQVKVGSCSVTGTRAQDEVCGGAPSTTQLPVAWFGFL